MCKRPSFDALVAEAERIGKPTRYLRDLYYHDRNYLEDMNPPCFGWQLRECGTHLFDPQHPQARSLVNAAITIWPDELLYWWDGTHLLAVTPEQLRAFIVRPEEHTRR